MSYFARSGKVDVGEGEKCPRRVKEVKKKVYQGQGLIPGQGTCWGC